MHPNIVVTGSPGVGKTYISMRISKLYGFRYVSVNNIIINNKLYSGYDEDRDSYIVDLDRAREFLANRFSWDGVVLEGHTAHLVAPSEYVDLCIVLRLDPYILFDRLVSRGYDRGKALENVQAEILDIVYREALDAYGSDSVISIDISGGYSKVLCAVDWLLGRCGKPDSDYVDWLGLVSENGDLKRFFP